MPKLWAATLLSSAERLAIEGLSFRLESAGAEDARGQEKSAKEGGMGVGPSLLSSGGCAAPRPRHSFKPVVR